MYHGTLQVLPPVPKIEAQLEPNHKALPVGTISAVSLALNSEFSYKLFVAFSEQKLRCFQHFIDACFFYVISDEETISSRHL